MKEYPILFSPAMIRAMLAGRKSVTRRLSKQWLKVRAGDKLWVRETWCDHDFVLGGEKLYRADGEFLKNWTARDLKWKPSIFMPRSWSRILLECDEDARVERLQEITEEEAIAEGLPIQMGDGTGGGPGYKWNGPGYHDCVSVGTFGPTYHVATGRHGKYCSCKDGEPLKLTPARCAYHCLWQSLHAKPGERWEDNPSVVRLKFRMIQ